MSNTVSCCGFHYHLLLKRCWVGWPGLPGLPTGKKKADRLFFHIKFIRLLLPLLPFRHFFQFRRGTPVTRPPPPPLPLSLFLSVSLCVATVRVCCICFIVKHASFQPVCNLARPNSSRSSIVPATTQFFLPGAFGARVGVPQVGTNMILYYYFSKKNVFSYTKVTCFFFIPNPDVVRYVIADVGPLPESAFFDASSTLLLYTMFLAQGLFSLQDRVRSVSIAFCH